MARECATLAEKAYRNFDDSSATKCILEPTQFPSERIRGGPVPVMAFAKIAHALGPSVDYRLSCVICGGCSGRLAYAFSSVVGFASRVIESAYANSLVNLFLVLKNGAARGGSSKG